MIQAEYEQTGAIEVGEETHLRIYQRRPAAMLDLPDSSKEGPATINVNSIEEKFNENTAPQRFTQKTTPDHELSVDFGNEITLLGYDLENAAVTAGSRKHLTLYWKAKQPILQNYHVFVQIGDKELWGQTDSAPVCNRLPTNLWRPDKVVIDRHRIEVNVDTPQGAYPLRLGLYLPETGDRIEPNLMNMGDNSILLTEIEVLYAQ